MLNIDESEQDIDYHLKWIVKSGFFVFLGIILSKVITYIYRVIIARYYGPEAYGLFALSLMVINWFIAISSLGLSEGILRYVSLYRGKNQFKNINYILKIVFKIQITTSVISAFILFFSAEFISINIFHDAKLIIFLKIFSLIIPFAILASLFLAVIRAFEKMQWYSFIVNVLQNIISFMSLIVMIFIGMNVSAIAISYIIGIFVMFFIAYLVCKYKIPKIFTKYEIKNKTLIKEIFNYSWPLIFLGMIGSILHWADTFIIGYFRTIIEVGLYNVAVPLAGFLNIIPDLFLQIFFPRVTKKYSQNKMEIIKQITEQITKWILLVNIPLFLIMFIFPGAIINILFGKEFIGAENALKIMTLGGLFITTAGISNSLLSMIGKSKLILKNTIVISIINVILNLYFIKKWGINGAAIVTSLCYILMAITIFIQVKKYTKINPINKNIIKIGSIALIPAGILIYIRRFFVINTFNIIILSSIYLIVYLLLIIITKSFDKKDIMIIKTIKEKIIKKI